MVAPVQLVNNEGRVARITEFGQLVVAPIDYSAPVFKDIDVIDQAFTFIAPKTHQAIVITDIVLSTDRNAPVNGSRITVYEALAADTLDEKEVILVEDLPRQAGTTLTGLNLLVPGGRWVNVKSDGVAVLVTIMFYRVPVEISNDG